MLQGITLVAFKLEIIFGFRISACEIKDFFASFRFRFSRNGGLVRFKTSKFNISPFYHTPLPSGRSLDCRRLLALRV